MASLKGKGIRLVVYSSVEPALLGRVLEFWNGRVPLFSEVEVHGPGELSWGLEAGLAADELRALVLDPGVVAARFAGGLPPALAPDAAGRPPLVLALPGAHSPATLEGIRAEVVDAAAAAAAAGVGELYDEEAGRLAGVPYSDLAYLAFGTALVRRAFALVAPEVKVIAVDCDGTLWRGVCAEDGAEGVVIGQEEKALHEFLLEQKRSGRLLALVSKNVPADVEAVFATRPDLGLSLSDFAAARVGWLSRSRALTELAEELGLGLEHFACLDDSSSECHELMSSIPETAVVPRPESDIRLLLGATWALDLRQGIALGDDRTRLYQEESLRRGAQRASLSYADHVAGLEVRTVIEVASAADQPRVFELSQRTNQFNTADGRPHPLEVGRLIAAGDVLVVRVADRFGDYGLVGAAFLSSTSECLVVDRLLLSCRVLGRGVEEDVLQALLDRARGQAAVALEFRFEPTPRNQPAGRFLELAAQQLGAERVGVDGQAAFRFRLAGLPPCPPLLGDDPTRVQREVTEPHRQGKGAVDWATVAELTADVDRLATELGLSSNESLAGGARGEQAVLAVIGDVIGCQVTAADNLYAVGFDSLRLIRLLARLKVSLGLELPVAEVLHRGDVADLLELAALSGPGTDPGEDGYLGQIRTLYDDR